MRCIGRRAITSASLNTKCCGCILPTYYGSLNGPRAEKFSDESLVTASMAGPERAGLSQQGRCGAGCEGIALPGCAAEEKAGKADVPCRLGRIGRKAISLPAPFLRKTWGGVRGGVWPQNPHLSIGYGLRI